MTRNILVDLVRLMIASGRGSRPPAAPTRRITTQEELDDFQDAYMRANEEAEVDWRYRDA